MPDQIHGIVVEIPLAPGEAQQFIGKELMCVPLTVQEVAALREGLNGIALTLATHLQIVSSFIEEADGTDEPAAVSEGRALTHATLEKADRACDTVRLLLARAKFISTRPEGIVQ